MRIATLFFFSLISFLFADDTNIDSKEVIKKAIIAQGGIDNLAKLKQYFYISKGNVRVLSNGKIFPFSREYFFQFPNRQREVYTIQIDGKSLCITSIATEYVGWFIANGETLKEMSKNDLMIANEKNYQWEIATLLPLLRESHLSLKYLGEKQIEDELVIGIMVGSKQFKDVELYFSKKQFLLYGMKSKENTVDHKELDVLTLFSDHKNHNGLLFPSKIIRITGEVKTIEEIIEFKSLNKMDKYLFEKPNLPPLPAPPPMETKSIEIPPPPLPPMNKK